MWELVGFASVVRGGLSLSLVSVPNVFMLNRTRFFLGLGGLFVILGFLVVGRAVMLESQQVAPEKPDTVSVAPDAPERLAEAVQYRTLTKRDPAALDSAAYRALFREFEQAFPGVHRALDTTHVNELSRLYTWQGADTTNAPIVLMAHVDVVPVEAEEDWTHDPFGGVIVDSHVWGRGTLDDKSSAVGLLEAVSTLVRQGERPARTVHIALGHDEEVGGPNGARAIAKHLTDDGPAPAIVVDEGGAITKGALPGLDRPLAVVGIAEKGYLSVELEAEGAGGHSSAPPDSSSIEILNEALDRLLDDPLPSRLDGVMGQTLDFVAPETQLPMRLALANRWLTAPALRWALNQSPATKAAIRTVQVPTRLDAGVKDNVIPSSARATLNYRILPSQSVDEVLDHVRSATDDLPVTIETGQASDPTPVSDVEGDAFRILQRTIREVTSDSVVVAPYLVPGATDSRHYASATDRVYRFVPYTLTPDDRSRIHGPNERISIEDYRTVVRFYVQLLRNAEALPSETG